MTERAQQAPLWLLPSASPDLPSLRKRHPVAAYVCLSIALLGLIPAFLLSSDSIWTPEAVFVVVFAASVACAAASTRVRSTVVFDSSTAPALVGVALFGPLAGACIFTAGEASHFFRDDRPGRQPLALMTNLTVSAWTCVAAGAILNTLGFDAPIDGADPLAYPAIVCAGAAMTAVNYVIMITASALYDGATVRSLLSTILRLGVASDFGMALVAALAIATYSAFGIVGLIVPLAAVALLPRFASRLLGTRTVRALDQSQAIAYYARLLANVFGVDRRSRGILADAAAQLGGRPDLRSTDDFQEVMQTVLYTSERWDGSDGGFPGVLSGDDIPLGSRILAVAQAWAALTAKETKELSPADALMDLKSRAGTEFDPSVIAAAVKAVEDEIFDEPARKGSPSDQPALSA